MKISPKLISVELNRIEFINETDNRVGTKQLNAMKGRTTTTCFDGGKSIQMYKEDGRFPTQLFTNIKNDRFKYVKNIT